MLTEVPTEFALVVQWTGNRPTFLMGLLGMSMSHLALEYQSTKRATL